MNLFWKVFITMTALLAAASCQPAPTGSMESSSSISSALVLYTNAGAVHYEKQGNNFVLMRNGSPYYIKGTGGQYNLALAAQYGANSTRTWDRWSGATALTLASNLNMTVMLGFWLSQNASDYTPSYKASMKAEVQTVISSYKNHPALLMWALGNELNLGQDTPAMWSFINELAIMIHQQDTNHLVCTVLSHPSPATLSNIVQYAPALQVLGINSYGGLTSLAAELPYSPFKGPYVITEWGPNGFWEVAQTSWGRPIEQTSAEKADTYLSRYQFIQNNSNVILGSYVFFWEQKQERTPTWFSMFTEYSSNTPATNLGIPGYSCPTADVMSYCWSGSWPANRAPDVTNMSLNGQKAADSVILASNLTYTARVDAYDRDGDTLSYIWEVLEEPTQLGWGGSAEVRPDRVGSVQFSSTNSINITTATNGVYRIFVYVTDGHNHAGTANIPFKVE